MWWTCKLSRGWHSWQHSTLRRIVGLLRPLWVRSVVAFALGMMGITTLLPLVEPDERGDPVPALRWMTKTLRHLADEITRQRHPGVDAHVGKLLREHGFSLQANAKTLEGAQHPDRDAQFRYLNEQVKDHQPDGEPVVLICVGHALCYGILRMAS